MSDDYHRVEEEARIAAYDRIYDEEVPTRWGDNVQVFTGSEYKTIHLPMILPTSGVFTITTGEPVTIMPGFQKIDIAITLHRDEEVER